MTTAYRLHYAPDNASLIIRLALLELEVPFDCALLDRETRAHKSAEYLALNPAGRIPALETPDGVMFETGAILLWLADKHQALFPKADDPARSHALKWLFYVSNTLHANLNLRFYPDQYTSEAHEALRAGAVENIKHAFSLLNDVAGEGHAWFNGPEVSILDLYVAATLRWSQIYPSKDYRQITADAWPHLLHMAQRLETRASVAELIKAEGLGQTPFSNPENFYMYQSETA